MLTMLLDRLRGAGRETAHPLILKNNATFRELSQDGPLTDYDFVVLDAEMTGLSARRNELISLAAVRVRDFRISPGEVYETLIRPEQGVPKSSTLIHGVSETALLGAPDLADVLPEFLAFLNGALIVGHGVGLDMGFLNRACRRHLGGAIHNPCVDTMRLAMVWEEERFREQHAAAYQDRSMGAVSYTLSDLTARYGLPRFPAHDPLGDALQTAYLFLYLVKKLGGGGVRTLKDLYRAGSSWRWYF